MAKSQKHEVTDEYSSIIDSVIDEWEEPENYPLGTWELVCLSLRHKEGEDKEGNPREEYVFSYHGHVPQGDVDPEAVENGDYKGKVLVARMYVNGGDRQRADAVRVQRRIKLHGVFTEGRTFKDLIAAKSLTGAHVLAEVGSRTYEVNGESRTENELRNFASVE